ncbi:MAG: heavy metal translocating P-type ATPase [Fimbriimonas sp.]
MRLNLQIESILTVLCGLALGLSFVPGLQFAAYFGVAFGSVRALQAAFESLRERQIDVDLLMVLAAGGAVAVGQPADACALLFLFSLSGTLEEMALGKTKSAIEGLIRLRPSQALVLRDGVETRLPLEQVKIGDTMLVPAFETIPIDGVVATGQSSVDQSSMTGESVAVAVSPGSKVIGGTQNMDGMLSIEVTSTVGDSTLDRIVTLMQEAQDNKASGERISTWFGQRYTIFVICAFAVSFVVRYLLNQPVNEALYSALTLLVGLSPCALVISVPATTLSALAWAAGHGMLVRGGKVMEDVGEIKQIAMDKTGTLTYGKPVLQEICVCVGEEVATVESSCGVETGCWIRGEAPSSQALQLLRLAAAAEQYSSHPVAAAVINAARDLGADVPEASEHRIIPGLGVSATVDGSRVLLGKEALMRQESVELPPVFLEHVRELGESGMTVSILYGSAGLAALGFRDTMRADAPAVLDELRNLGIGAIIMLTGDNQQTANAMAKAVGVDSFAASLMPEDKARRIQELAAKGPVMMVGDGVNDAPSLSGATVGVAMGGLGSDVALNAADIVLIHDKLSGIPSLIKLGRKTQRIIRANLVFAALVIVSLTVASFVTKLPLPVAVVAHEGSTVLVILNGLRLLRGP